MAEDFDSKRFIKLGAIATTAGWVMPKTGELLASRKNLKNAVPYVKGKKDYLVEEASVEAPSVEAALASVVAEETPVETPVEVPAVEEASVEAPAVEAAPASVVEEETPSVEAVASKPKHKPYKKPKLSE